MTSLIDLPGSVRPEPRTARVPPLRVMLRGADGAVGRKVREMLSLRSDVEVRISEGPQDKLARGSVDVMVELGAGDHDHRAQRRESVTLPAAELIAEAEECGVDHILFVSTAMVYGASPSNPIPLSEEAVLRPDPDFVFARQMASAEQLVEQWRLSQPGRVASVLRPVVIMSAGDSSGLARALAAGSASRFGEEDPGSQFVHLDDVASAVVHVIMRRLDGVFNVAPDGWIPSARVRALTGERMSLPLPSQVVEVLGALRWRLQRGPIPPGLRSYIVHPWLVANDRLRSTGWVPQVTNEQAYVEGTEAQWWTMVSPRRRQEMALAGLGVGVVGLLGFAIWVMVRWRRRVRLQ